MKAMEDPNCTRSPDTAVSRGRRATGEEQEQDQEQNLKQQLA
jgi:hypothetical protein